MFINDLILKVSDKNKWELIQDFIWKSSGDEITVPKGFVTDLASIPKILRILPYLDPTGKNREPAVLHDYLYAIQTTTRKRADKIFRQALKEQKIPTFWSYLHYLGVRLGGKFSWNKRKK